MSRPSHESGMAADGADRRDCEAQLKELRQTLASVEVGLWDLRLSTQEFRVNRRWLEMLGYAEGELEPTLSAWKRLCHPEDLYGLERCIQEHQEGRSPTAEFEYRARSKNGRWISLQSRVRAVAHEEGGRPVRLLGTEVDITAVRKSSDERFQALLFKCGQLASRGFATPASQGQMVSTIASDLNKRVSYTMSNLGAIRQYFQELQPVLQMQRELIQAGAEKEPSAQSARLARLRELWADQQLEEVLQDFPDLFQDALAIVQHIRELTRRLCSFAWENPREPQLVDLNAELERSLHSVWEAIRDKCAVQREYGALPSVPCFPSQLAQVFPNLLVNAAQAIEERGVIHIRTWRDGDEAAVEISDTGKGMTSEVLAQLATPFFSTKRGSLGLGLYISYGIVSSLKGRIEVRSELDQGTSFTIRLPLSAA